MNFQNDWSPENEDRSIVLSFTPEAWEDIQSMTDRRSAEMGEKVSELEFLRYLLAFYSLLEDRKKEGYETLIVRKIRKKFLWIFRYTTYESYDFMKLF
jgi:hypothetical protein